MILFSIFASCYVLRRQNIALRVDFPILFIEIEYRDNIDQFHIGFPIGTERSDILPVSVVFIRKYAVPPLKAVGDDMLAKIACGLIDSLIRASFNTFQLNM